LTPVISSFSTYKKSPSESRKSIREKGISLPIAAWKNAQPLSSPFADPAIDSSKTSLSSFDIARAIDEQPSSRGLKAPRQIRMEESREELVSKCELNGKDSAESHDK
jgi:hypothetical protein